MAISRPGCVVLDVVGTVMLPFPTVPEVYAGVGARHGSRLSVFEVGQRFRQAFRESETACFTSDRLLQTSEAEELNRWKWIVAQSLPDIQNPETCFQELWGHFARSDSWRVFDDVEPLLQGLEARQIPVVIASNFDHRVHGLCDAVPELKKIQRRVISSEVGYRKPASEFYAAVEAVCGVPADQMLMVGDDPVGDVAGPLRSGWNALWLNRAGGVNDDDSITTLTALFERLEE